MEQAFTVLRRREYLGLLLSSLDEGIYGVDRRGRISFINPVALRMLGFAAAEVIGHEQHQCFHFSPPHRHDRVSADRQCPVRQALADGHPRRDELEWFIGKNGRAFPVRLNITPMREGHGQAGAIVVFRDATERYHLEDQIRHQATHDPLTGLPNLTLFSDRLQQAIYRVRRHGTRLAVLMLDLDNFKEVNNTFGHADGDQLLVELAGRLLAALRKSDTVARYGGDEFVLLLPELQEDAAAAEVSAKLLHLFATPFATANCRELFSGASLGIACYPEHGDNEETLLCYADLAMRQAKRNGRGTYAFYSSELDHRQAEHLRLHGRLKHALAAGAFTLDYQPQVEVGGGRLMGVEALLRWRDEELGEVTPDRFIPVAEATGLILPLGEWVLYNACCQLADWQRRGYDFQLAVNLSVQQFRQWNLVERLREFLELTGAPPRCLELEITETAAMENIGMAARQLAGLRRLGVGIALDDFGTGYSSLAYLKNLPITKLKIDRTFIGGLGGDGDHNELIVRTVIGLARGLGLHLVAEGVETAAQLVFLQRHGCDACQGWFFARAMPVEELEDWLAGRGGVGNK